MSNMGPLILTISIFVIHLFVFISHSFLTGRKIICLNDYILKFFFFKRLLTYPQFNLKFVTMIIKINISQMPQMIKKIFS